MHGSTFSITGKIDEMRELKTNKEPRRTWAHIIRLMTWGCVYELRATVPRESSQEAAHSALLAELAKLRATSGLVKVSGTLVAGDRGSCHLEVTDVIASPAPKSA